MKNFFRVVFMAFVASTLVGCGSQIVRLDLLNKDHFEAATARPTVDASMHVNSIYSGTKVDENGLPLLLGRTTPTVTPSVAGQVLTTLPAALIGAGASLGGAALYTGAVRAGANATASAMRHVADKNAETSRYMVDHQRPTSSTNFLMAPQANAFSTSESANQNSSGVDVNVNSGGGCAWGDC